MQTPYQPIADPRFKVEYTSDGEQFVAKARKQIFALLFLPVWLAGWTAGGALAISEFIREPQPFLGFWLCGWLLGWIFAAATIAWMLTGAEAIRTVGRDIEIAHRAFGMSRRRLYQGSEISNLSVSGQDPLFRNFRLSAPFFRGGQSGSVKFNYGPRTIYAMNGLDEAEAQMIVDRLAANLPR